MIYLGILGLTTAVLIAYELYAINSNIVEIGKFLEESKE